MLLYETSERIFGPFGQNFRRNIFSKAELETKIRVEVKKIVWRLDVIVEVFFIRIKSY